MISINIGYFNAKGINDIEHWFKLEADELRRRGHKVKYFNFNSPPNKRDIKWMDFAHYHFAQVASHFARICNVPFCVSPHTSDIFPDHGRKLRIVSKNPLCKFVTYQSKYHLSHFKKWGIKKPLVYLPMSVRTNLFVRKEPLGNKILAGGRLVPRKGLDRVLNSLENVDIFGDGPLEDYLRGLQPKATFHGHISGEDLRRLYEESCVYLFPAVIVDDGNRDGIPNTVKEAMLMELPVIASSVSGLPELENIYRFDDWEDKEALDNILQVAINCGKNTKGREEILSIYSPEKCVGRLEEAIEKYA